MVNWRGLRYRGADYRVMDVEAEQPFERPGLVLVAYPDRHGILRNRGQVEPGRLDVHGPGTATFALGRRRGPDDSRRYGSRPIEPEERSVV